MCIAFLTIKAMSIETDIKQKNFEALTRGSLSIWFIPAIGFSINKWSFSGNMI